MSDPRLNVDRATFSAPPEVMKAAQAKADAQGQKFSTYIAKLVERDLAGQSADAMSPNVIVDLSRRLLGELDAGQMEVAMQGKDQRKKLKNMLEAVLSEEFDLHAYAADYVKQGGETEGEKRIEEVATMAGDNFRTFVERRLKKEKLAGFQMSGKRTEEIQAGEERPEHPRATPLKRPKRA